MIEDSKAQVANAREERQMGNEIEGQNGAEGTLRTPDDWCRIEGVQILDPDGWRGRNGRPWIDPISLAEFRDRLATCTQRSTQPAGEHHTGTLNLAGQGNPEPITIPAGTELWRLMGDTDHENFVAWIRSNNIRPHAVTIERDVTISDTIDRWEIVGDDEAEMPTGHSQRSGYELQPGEEWTTDDEFAKAIRQVSSCVTTPMPDDIHEKLTKALAIARKIGVRS